MNDYIDRDIDKISHPERPLPSGDMTPKEALCAGAGAFILSAVIAIAAFFLTVPDQSIVLIVIVLIACALMLSYELFLKQRGFIGNVTIAVLTGMLFLLGGAAAGDIYAVAVTACMAVLVSIGREIAKDIEDMEGDEGRNTLPMRYGIRTACAISSVMIIAGTLLSVWPIVAGMFGMLYYVVFSADAVFIWAAFIVFKDAGAAQKLCKYAMLIALIAFILGAVFP